MYPVCLCLCLSPLCLQGSDVHAEVRITGMCVPEPIMYCHVCFPTANIFVLFIYECSMIRVLLKPFIVQYQLQQP